MLSEGTTLSSSYLSVRPKYSTCDFSKYPDSAASNFVSDVVTKSSKSPSHSVGHHLQSDHCIDSFSKFSDRSDLQESLSQLSDSDSIPKSTTEFGNSKKGIKRSASPSLIHPPKKKWIYYYMAVGMIILIYEQIFCKWIIC